jgi:hypothetical protein
VLFAGILSAFALLLGVGLASPSHAAGDGAQPGGTVLGTTEGWLNGRTVTFFYTRDYSCPQPPVSSAASGCEVGEATDNPPIGDPDIPEVWVLVPLGFTPPRATLQCPEAGNCVAHPHDIDLSRLFGPDAADVPTPAHSHVIDDLQGGWWEGFVVGVKNEATWDRIVAGKSIATIRAIQQADPDQANITSDIPTNLFLFFNVLPE